MAKMNRNNCEKIQVLYHPKLGWMRRNRGAVYFRQMDSDDFKKINGKYITVSVIGIPKECFHGVQRNKKSYRCKDCGKHFSITDMEKEQCRDCFIGVPPVELEIELLRKNMHNIIPIGGKDNDNTQHLILSR